MEQDTGDFKRVWRWQNQRGWERPVCQDMMKELKPVQSTGLELGEHHLIISSNSNDQHHQFVLSPHISGRYALIWLLGTLMCSVCKNSVDQIFKLHRNRLFFKRLTSTLLIRRVFFSYHIILIWSMVYLQVPYFLNK